MLRHSRRTRVIGYPDSGLKPLRFCRVGGGFQCLTTGTVRKDQDLLNRGLMGRSAKTM